jgi:hypothetical protein
MARTEKRHRRTKAEIQKLKDAILAVLGEDNPMTVRQVFYRLVSSRVIEKTERAHDSVGAWLVKMRLAGEVPWEWISDNTRWMRKPRTYDSLRQAMEMTARNYRRSLWTEQEAYVEIWCEKDALAGVLAEVTREWDVPLMVSRGFSSVSYLWQAAETIADQDKPAYLYYFGDHDPSGVLIDRSIEARLQDFLGEWETDSEIHFQRVAVLPHQIEEMELPTRPTKRDSPIGKKFKGDSVEVDAIPPNQLRALVRDCIEQHVDERQLAVTRAAEKSERETVLALARALDKERTSEIPK